MATESGITVYQNRDFDGNPVTLAAGSYDYYQITDKLKINDRILSIKIPPGYTVTVYEHNFKGKTATFRDDTPYVGDEYANLISSIRVEYDEENAKEVTALFSVVKFNGASSTITTPKSLANSLSAFTLEVWVKPFSLKDNIFFHQETVVEFSIRNSKLFYWVRASNTISGYVDTPLTVQEWHHVALVGDRTNTRIYLDGNLVKTVGITVQNTYSSSSCPFVIGAGLWSGRYGGFFDGEMTEARVWNVARSQADIQASMNKRLSGKEPNLIAYYPLNEINLDVNNTPRALDMVGGNHGTATNVVKVYDVTVPLKGSN